MNNAPIGVFDSGLGGLTVWRELYRKLPHESLIYYGDGKNCPYGDKNREEVTAYVDLAVRRLIDRGVKLIVVACNAATAMAIDHLRRNYALPLVGLEPAVKPAAMASRSGVIGILATAATLNGRLFRETSQRYA
ncbi:MAG: glutamate racemase, partial [Alistipes sp.]